MHETVKDYKFSAQNYYRPLLLSNNSSAARASWWRDWLYLSCRGLYCGASMRKKLGKEGKGWRTRTHDTSSSTKESICLQSPSSFRVRVYASTRSSNHIQYLYNWDHLLAKGQKEKEKKEVFVYFHAAEFVCFFFFSFFFFWAPRRNQDAEVNPINPLPAGAARHVPGFYHGNLGSHEGVRKKIISRSSMLWSRCIVCQFVRSIRSGHHPQRDVSSRHSALFKKIY